MLLTGFKMRTAGFERALALRPNYAEAHYNLARGEMVRLDEALLSMARALEAKPGSPQARLRPALAPLHTGSFHLRMAQLQLPLALSRSRHAVARLSAASLAR